MTSTLAVLPWPRHLPLLREPRRLSSITPRLAPSPPSPPRGPWRAAPSSPPRPRARPPRTSARCRRPSPMYWSTDNRSTPKAMSCIALTAARGPLEDPPVAHHDLYQAGIRGPGELRAPLRRAAARAGPSGVSDGRSRGRSGAARGPSSSRHRRARGYAPQKGAQAGALAVSAAGCRLGVCALTPRAPRRPATRTRGPLPSPCSPPSASRLPWLWSFKQRSWRRRGSNSKRPSGRRTAPRPCPGRAQRGVPLATRCAVSEGPALDRPRPASPRSSAAETGRAERARCLVRGRACRREMDTARAEGEDSASGRPRGA